MFMLYLSDPFLGDTISLVQVHELYGYEQNNFVLISQLMVQTKKATRLLESNLLYEATNCCISTALDTKIYDTCLK